MRLAWMAAGAAAVFVSGAVPALGGPDQLSATGAASEVGRALGLAKKADKRSKNAAKTAKRALRVARNAPRGPEGPRGPQGEQGLQGLPGQPPAVEDLTTVGSLGGGWIPWEAGTEVRYFKDLSGVVHLQGAVSDGTAGRATPLFTLPPGYRPAAPFLEFAPLATSDSDVPAPAMVEICGNSACSASDPENDPGEVYIVVGPSNFVSLDGITFRSGG